MPIASIYSGPQCPRCRVTLPSDAIRSGVITCPHCHDIFEATAFTPPQRAEAANVVEVMAVGPEGANACANHARNAATAVCQRCGLFICSLCDMNVGTGSYCPSCFERVRTEGMLQPAARRYRDYAMMARTSAIVGVLFGFMFLGLPFGAATVYYGLKARKQRISEGRSTAGMVFAIVVGALEMLAGIGTLLFIFYAIGKAASK